MLLVMLYKCSSVQYLCSLLFYKKIDHFAAVNMHAAFLPIWFFVLFMVFNYVAVCINVEEELEPNLPVL